MYLFNGVTMNGKGTIVKKGEKVVIRGEVKITCASRSLDCRPWKKREHSSQAADGGEHSLRYGIAREQTKLLR